MTIEIPSFEPRKGVSVGVFLALERVQRNEDPIHNLVEAHRLLYGREPDMSTSIEDVMNEVVVAISAQMPDVIEPAEVWRDHQVEVVPAHETGLDAKIFVTHGDTAACRTPGTQRCLVGDAAANMKNVPDPTPGLFSVTGLTTDGFLILEEIKP